MLWTPGNDFNWSVDCFGSTYTNAAFGVTATSGAANTKGTPVSLIAGASVTEDVYGMSIVFAGGSSTGNARQFLADILVDPAGGTSWTVLGNNLISCGSSLIFGGYCYYFPIYLKSGTSIGWQHQCGVTTIAMRCGVRLHGKPSRPDLVKVGSVIETFGANTATSAGVAITPGNTVLGSYTASLGTTVRDLWWWQGGLSSGSAAMTVTSYFLDVAVDATTKLLCAQNINVNSNSNETLAKEAFGTQPPFRFIQAGNTVYMRAACLGAPDTSMSVCAYGLGG